MQTLKCLQCQGCLQQVKWRRECMALIDWGAIHCPIFLSSEPSQGNQPRNTSKQKQQDRLCRTRILGRLSRLFLVLFYRIDRRTPMPFTLSYNGLWIGLQG